MQLTKKQLWLFIASLLLVAALTFGLTFVFTRQAKPEPEIRYVPVEYPAIDGVPDRYRELCALLRLYSYYGLPEDTDFDGAFARAIVAATKDPYAEYFTAAEYAEYRADLSGEFYGIGVTVDSFETADDAPAIRLLDVFTGSGAMAAGLQKGDLIVAVDGTGAWAFDLEAGPGTGVYAPLCQGCLMDLGRWLRDGRAGAGRHDVVPHTEDVDF